MKKSPLWRGSGDFRRWVHRALMIGCVGIYLWHLPDAFIPVLINPYNNKYNLATDYFSENVPSYKIGVFGILKKRGVQGENVTTKSLMNIGQIKFPLKPT